MPSATVTVRELKNKDTRVDITVPTYKETKGLLQSTFEFHVVIVSSLPFFKSAKHKPTDVVQYMVSKKFAEFEDLHSKLSAKFSGTVLPPLSKKTLLVNAAVTKERRGNLDSFLKFVACTPKLCTSSVLLEFLGVNGIKAGKYRKDEELEEDPGNSKSSEDQDDSSLQDAPDTEQSLFDDDDEENTDEFFSKEEDAVGEDIEIGDDYRNRFEGDTKLFEDQDLTGAFTEDDANDFVLPDAKNPKTKEDLSMFTDDDNSDLFQIDDDLDKFLNIETKKPETKPKPSPHPPPEKSEKPEISPQKPPVSQKKPTISTQKPTPATRKPKSSGNPSECQAVKPSIKPKPGLSPKPVLPKKPASSEVKPILPNQSATTEKPEKQTVENLDTDDIMQYIQENVTQDDELDLFS